MTLLENLANAIAHAPLTAAVRSAVTRESWFIPEIQIVHIIAIAAVVIAAALINLRALGLIETDRTHQAVWRAWFPVILTALVVLAGSGYLLIASEPGRALFRTVFWVKLAFIVLATAATWAQCLPLRGKGLPRVLAIVSLLLWIEVIFAGRWIAYADGWAGAAS